MGDFRTVATVDQVPAGTMKVIDVEGRRIALSHVDGAFYAMDDLCSHADASLGDGSLHGDEVECPRHGGRFNVRTGAAVRLPAVTPVVCHTVRVDGQNIQVQWED